MKKTRVCMIVQDKMVKGGIAAVTGGYYSSELEERYDISYVESYKDGGKVTKLLKGIRGYLHFACVLMTKRPQIVHIHSSFGPSFYRKMPFIYMASWAGIPIVNHIHGADFDEFYLDAGEKKKKRVKKIYDRCSVLIALSDEWKERLSMIVPAEKVEIIENYSILHEDALYERNGRDSNNTVLFLGEIGRRKGCYDIPEVVKKVNERIPGVRFIMGGAGSPADEAAVKGKISELGVEAYAEFPGWVRGDVKDRLLREADIFFLPSYNEGMPMSILDAMGYGLPVVSTNVGGIPRIVRNGENGFCIEPGDTESMAEAICGLFSDVNGLRHAGNESMRIVREGYSLESHIERLTAVYEKALRDRK